MRVEKRLNELESNQRMTDLLRNKSEFLVGRIGLGGDAVVPAIILNGQFPNQTVLFWLYNTAGFYGPLDLQRYSHLYADACKNQDYNLYWSHKGFIEVEDYLVPEHIELLEPSILSPFEFEEPWTKELKGRKVLIIHPFKKTIDKQLLLKDKLWSNGNILPEAEYITYQSVQSLGGRGPHSSWYESFDRMCDDISKIDFDIALLGCGAYGMPLSNFIKKDLKRGAIYFGGPLQLLFGIKGHRWDNSNLYTDLWVRHEPTLDDTPDFKNYIPEEPGGSYW